jgi:hypothetical protein
VRVYRNNFPLGIAKPYGPGVDGPFSKDRGIEATCGLVDVGTGGVSLFWSQDNRTDFSPSLHSHVTVISNFKSENFTDTKSYQPLLAPATIGADTSKQDPSPDEGEWSGLPGCGEGTGAQQ